MKYEPYKSNQEFIDNVNQLSEKLDRFTIRNYLNELLYFVKLEIPKTIYERYSGFSISSEEEYEIGDITHLSAHSLGDIYFSEGNYKLAKDFYIKAIFTHPLITSSGTSANKDVDRIIYDLAKNAYKAEKKDEAYAFLMALMFDSNINTEEDICGYFKEQNEDKRKLKKDIDKALRSLKKEGDYNYTFVFRGNKVFFIPLIQENVKRAYKNV